MLSPERAITVYADDILDAKMPDNGARRIGPGALFYPDHLNQGTVPRMWDEKQKNRDGLKKIKKAIIISPVGVTLCATLHLHYLGTNADGKR